MEFYSKEYKVLSEAKTNAHLLDITSEVCPMTLVRAKLRIERMAAGETLEIRLNAGEPLENVPRALAELGHEVESLGPEGPDGAGSPYRLRVRKR
jgi:TusA-related sulfurtransferase